MKPEKQAKIDALIQQEPLLWKASTDLQGNDSQNTGLDTGFDKLNNLLKTKGWPKSSLIEIQVDEWGQGELQLLLPVMAALSQQQQQLAWIAPPYIPYAPALQAAGIDLDYLLIIEHSDPGDVAWAAEKCLRHASAAMVLFCLPMSDARHIRRLQVAADTGGNFGVLLHCGQTRQTPVALRLKVNYVSQGLRVQVLKSRFGLEEGKHIVLQTETLPFKQGDPLVS